MSNEYKKTIIYCAYANKNNDKTLIEPVMLDSMPLSMTIEKFWSRCGTMAKAMAKLRGFDGGICLGIMSGSLDESIEQKIENVRLSGMYNYLYEIEGFIKYSVFPALHAK